MARNPIITFFFWAMLSLLHVSTSVYSLLSNQHSLKRHFLNDTQLPGIRSAAVCNDGSPGIYYLNHRRHRSKWLIFVEGGGGCTNSSTDCMERFRKNPYFMSSNNYPKEITPQSIMADPQFKDFNKAVFVYCSSDSWLGDSLNDFRIHDKKNMQFTFRGSVIFMRIVETLSSKNKLHKASEVVLVGQSSGGIGLANHLSYLRDKLSQSCKISAIFDSAWFINFDGYFKQGSSEIMKNTGLAKHEHCQDHSWGFPCCFSVSCMLSKSLIPRDISLFFIISKYDIYILFDRLIKQNSTDSNILKNKDILLRVHSYGGRMEQSLGVVESRENISFVFTSCFQHNYLTSSNLWDILYKSDITLTFSSVQFQHLVHESIWKSISIKGKSIRDMVLQWRREISEITRGSNSTVSGKKKRNAQVYDNCLHAQCNPTCPRMVFFNDFKSTWEFWQKVLLISCVMFITICCLFVKCHWMIQHYKLKKSQALYLNVKYEGRELFEKVMCLPTCPPHSAIGISCANVDYDVSSISDPSPMPGDKGKWKRRESMHKLRFGKRLSNVSGKKIIKGITAYFNPGQLVAIMGPSGSGKTTLLDVLTARKHFKEAESNIFINGLPAEETREWFIKNSGYVLQLATPYHEELTVRQNLTYSAMMRLPMKMKVQDKLWRVEQVLGQCGLYDVADVVVGDNSPVGGGLSGGQKRRLCIALQLLDLPSVIFLDEPTSGLDSASSLELLETLHGLTMSGRLVVVTIHQPRIEIFHMFDAILFLCDGQVAYFGSPIMAPTMIAGALEGSNQVFDASNPADSIMDVLTNPESQKFILDNYVQSGEIQAINRAIERAKRHPQKTLSMKFERQTSSFQNRLLALDGRSAASQTFSQMFYFPIIFLMYGLALGTCYFQTGEGILLMSCYMVFSCASQLFMASVIHAHLNKAFALFSLEKADGVSHSTELVLHVFIRTFSQSSIPLICSCVIIYLCTVREYVLWKFCLTTLIHLQLNQTWIAIIVFTACSIPRYSSLVTPLLSAVAGFAGGFLVPEPQMPAMYYWMFYVNPTHWAYSGMMKALMSDVTFDCSWYNSPLECQESTGIVILENFGLSQRNPYASMVVLLSMLVLFLVLSVVVLEVKYSKRKWDKVKRSYWQAFRQAITSCHRAMMENYTRKKRMREEAERQRLFKLVEQQYRYKSETYDSAYCSPNMTDEMVAEQQKSNRIRLEYTAEGVIRERANTILEEEYSEESYNSSNDEDIDPTLTKESRRKSLLMGIRKAGSQQSSFSSLFTKIQSGIISKSKISIESNNEETPKQDVKLRKKSHKSRKWKSEKRRKTFAGFIEEEKEGIEDDVEYEDNRPKSVLLPPRKQTESPDPMATMRIKRNEHQQKKLRRPRSWLDSNLSTPQITPAQSMKDNYPGGTEHSHDTEHSHEANVRVDTTRTQAPPDIVIDIGRNVPEERPTLEQSQRNNRQILQDNIESLEDRQKGADKNPEQTLDDKRFSNTIINYSRSFDNPAASSLPASTNNTLTRKRKKKTKESKETWSKYLDVQPKRHEVYCALNSVKKRLRGKVKCGKGTLARKTESVHLQRKESSLILNKKKDSMRNQLSDIRSTHLSDETENPSAKIKKDLVLKARENVLPNSEIITNSDNNNNTISKNSPLGDETKIDDNLEVAPHCKTCRTGDKSLLERLSLLSSQRSSIRSSIATVISSKRNSNINSQYSVLDDMLQENEPSPQVYNALRKLHDSIDQLEDDKSEENTRIVKGEEQIEELNTSEFLEFIETDSTPTTERQHRDSDPLLPEERLLIEGLLFKYQHLDSARSSKVMLTPPPAIYLNSISNEKENDKVVFSSKMKIRKSMGHSRKPSDVSEKQDDNSINEALQSSPIYNVSEKSLSCREEVFTDDITSKTNANEGKHTKMLTNPENMSEEGKKQVIIQQQKPRTRRISTVKEVAGKFEALQQRGQQHKETNQHLYQLHHQQQTLQNQQKQQQNQEKCYYQQNRYKHTEHQKLQPKYPDKTSQQQQSQNQSSKQEQQSHQKFSQQLQHKQSLEVSSDSSSSSEDDIVKTHEGFIIPDDAIDRLNYSKTRVINQPLQEEEEEIERQFKKDNFLKDRPARKGIRVPMAPAGKVNQLKSKFEGKHLASSLVSERLSHSAIRPNKHRQNQSDPSQSHGAGGFFRMFRRSSKTNDSESEMELGNFLNSRGHHNHNQLTNVNFCDQDTSSGSDYSFKHDFMAIASERDFIEAYIRERDRYMNLPTPKNYNTYSSSDEDDCISQKSGASDRSFLPSQRSIKRMKPRRKRKTRPEEKRDHWV